MINIQVRPVRALDGNDQTLLIRCRGSPTSLIAISSILIASLAATIVPDGQIFEVFVSHICVLGVLWIRENFFFLSLEILDNLV